MLKSQAGNAYGYAEFHTRRLKNMNRTTCFRIAQALILAWLIAIAVFSGGVAYAQPVDEKKLITDAISGMVASLDPHSQYFDKKTFKEFREGTTGRFVGVGIEITMAEGLVKVVSPIEGSPAFRAGLKPGDLITKVDDTAIKGLSLNDAVKRMRGEPNTRVVLTVFRKDESRTFPVTIVREEIKTQSVKGKVIEPGYAWLRVSQFQESTVEDFAKKLEEIHKQEPQLKGLVLDLRGNPGGLLNEGVEVAGHFLKKNDLVVSHRGRAHRPD